MKSAKYLILSILCAFSMNAFAEDCRTFAVGKIDIIERDSGGWIKIHAKNKGSIYHKHGKNSENGKDAVSWSFASPASQHWYNLALTSLTTGIPVTVCQASDLEMCENGPAPYTCRFSSMYMEN